MVIPKNNIKINNTSTPFNSWETAAGKGLL